MSNLFMQSLNKKKFLQVGFRQIGNSLVVLYIYRIRSLFCFARLLFFNQQIFFCERVHKFYNNFAHCFFLEVIGFYC